MRQGGHGRTVSEESCGRQATRGRRTSTAQGRRASGRHGADENTHTRRTRWTARRTGNAEDKCEAGSQGRPTRHTKC
eukprot:8835546-Alexandrium_andersonii.AAC.1